METGEETLSMVHQWPHFGQAKEAKEPTKKIQDFENPTVLSMDMGKPYGCVKDDIQLSQAQHCLATKDNGKKSLLLFNLWTTWAWIFLTERSCEI